MMKKIAVCPQCKTKNMCQGETGQKIVIKCSNCGKKGLIKFIQNAESQIHNKQQPEKIKQKEISQEPEISEKIADPLKKQEEVIKPKTEIEEGSQKQNEEEPLKSNTNIEHEGSEHKTIEPELKGNQTVNTTKQEVELKDSIKKDEDSIQEPSAKDNQEKDKNIIQIGEPKELKINADEIIQNEVSPEQEIKEPVAEIEASKQLTKLDSLDKKEVETQPEVKIEPPLMKNEKFSELDFYSVNEPFAYIKIIKEIETLDKYYKIIEPNLSSEESATLKNIEEKLIESINVRLDELDPHYVENFLFEQINLMIANHAMKADELLIKKYLYFVKRDFLGYGRIDSLMKDPNIEDISCDGSEVPIFLYHRKYGSLKSNIIFDDEEELSAFVVKLAQKCGKHISIAEPMLDATMPDGSRIQMTLSKAVTTKGSTFTIRKFRADPITATDLIEYNTMSPEMVAYMWMAVENGISALIAGSTAAGKTSTLNALCLFIPKESKIVSIEETREINLPHPNWIPGIARSGFGEVVHDKLAGEIDLFDLMKAALRQRPEYILVGEIRGKEAYVLFQAMATGHTTYSTFHADSPKSCIHRLEGKPIDVPRVMLKCLDIIFIQVSTKLGPKHVRRCKQIVEIVDIDPTTKEILMNEVFRWDPVDDKFIYSGKSYILERIRSQYDMSKDEIMQEVKRRVEVLQWMRKKDIRLFQEVARTVVHYTESPDELMEKIRKNETIVREESNKAELVKSPTPKENDNKQENSDSEQQNEKINEKEILEG